MNIQTTIPIIQIQYFKEDKNTSWRVVVTPSTENETEHNGERNWAQWS